MTKGRRFTGPVLAAFLLIVFLMLAVRVKGAAEDVISITVPFSTPGMGDVEYAFPYSDSLFLDSSETFSRDLARASMGLMVSAFRKLPRSNIENQYETYLKAAGFQEIHAFGYDKPTGIDTVSGVIAHKQIDGFTLIAAAPCGQGYDKEWGGNLQLGNGVRHEGFEKAAQIMEKELEAYIEACHLEGPRKLWITGFSRAAAVGNLTAADEIASGRFSDVYAYLFGVPRTTREPQPYPGIYNVCGKADPVTMVPLESWGFGRYGTDLYLPAMETDQRYFRIMLEADEVCQEITGDEFRFSPELNHQVHLILEFLGELFPSQEEFVDHMQDVLMNLWKDEKVPDEVEQIILAAVVQLEDLDERQEYSSEVFVDYMTYLVEKRIADNRKSNELRDLSWADDQGMGANLLREHMPYIYMSWVFSDNPEDAVFNGPGETRKIFILGDVDVEIWDGEVFIDGVQSDGSPVSFEELQEAYTAEELLTSVFLVRNGEETLICLPMDTEYQIIIKKKDQQGFIYYYDYILAAGSTYGTGDKMSSILVEPGHYLLEYPPDGGVESLTASEGSRILQQIDQDYTYSPTMVMEIEVTSDSESHFSFEEMLVVIMAGAAGLALLFLICLIIGIVHAVRKKRGTHGPYSPWYVIVPHLLLLGLTLYISYFVTGKVYTIVTARVAAAAGSMVIVFLLALRGLIRHRNLLNVILTAAVLGLAFVNCLVYQKSRIVSAGAPQFPLYCAAVAVMTAAAVLTFRGERYLGKKKDRQP